MATYYVGYRPILRGKSTNNLVNTYTGKVGKYSNWDLMNNGGQILSGAPDKEYVLGTFKHAGHLEYLFAGGQHRSPMRGAGNGIRQAGSRFSPMTYRGLAGAGVFKPGYGHVDRVTNYSLYNNFIYDGLAQREALAKPGHARRFTSTWGGAFDPYVNKGTGEATSLMTVPAGRGVPVGFNNPYGHNRVNEWNGVRRAL